jgi:hypothetical protein
MVLAPVADFVEGVMRSTKLTKWSKVVLMGLVKPRPARYPYEPIEPITG